MRGTTAIGHHFYLQLRNHLNPADKPPWSNHFLTRDPAETALPAAANHTQCRGHQQRRMMSTTDSPTNILVFPCGSEIGLEIYRSLEPFDQFRLIGGSSCSDHGEYVYSHYVSNFPHVTSADFIPFLRRAIQAHNIQIVFPAHDDAVLTLASARPDLDALVATSSAATCTISRSKSNTYAALADHVPCPRLYPPDSPDTQFPVFLKPDQGQGSRGTAIAYTHEDIARSRATDSTLIICENLPGDEYTVDCFTDASRTLRVVSPRTRDRTINGISARSSSCDDDPIFFEYADRINNVLELNGAWFFQLKRSASGVLTLLEVAPRIAGTMGLTRARGANLPLLTVNNLLGHEVSTALNFCGVSADRALDVAFRTSRPIHSACIGFETALLRVNEQLDPSVVAFVFRCRHRGIPVSLVTAFPDQTRIDLTACGLQPTLFQQIDTAENLIQTFPDSNSFTLAITNCAREAALFRDRTNAFTCDISVANSL
jgi:predicted ATP-grasp superfamily ATP-dependent carboligase